SGKWLGSVPTPARSTAQLFDLGYDLVLGPADLSLLQAAAAADVAANRWGPKSARAKPGPARRRTEKGWRRGRSEGGQGQDAQHGVVRQGRPRRLRPPRLDEESGPAGPPLRWPAGHRNLQHLVGADALQRPFPRAGGAGEARRLRGRRLPRRIPGHLAGRDQP